jgi:hypothetical protein
MLSLLSERSTQSVPHESRMGSRRYVADVSKGLRDRTRQPLAVAKDKDQSSC